MNIEESFKNQSLYMGNVISISKTMYRDANPKSVCVFNANVITLKEGKVWWGDLDLTKHGEALKAVAAEIGETIYVLSESDGYYEGQDASLLIGKAVWNTTQEIPTL